MYPSIPSDQAAGLGLVPRSHCTRRHVAEGQSFVAKQIANGQRAFCLYIKIKQQHPCSVFLCACIPVSLLKVWRVGPCRWRQTGCEPRWLSSPSLLKVSVLGTKAPPAPCPGSAASSLYKNPLTRTVGSPFIPLKTKMKAVKRLVSVWNSKRCVRETGRRGLFPALDQSWQLCSCSDLQAMKCCLAFWCWHVSIPFHISLYKYTLCVVYYGTSIDGEKRFEVKLFVILY